MLLAGGDYDLKRPAFGVYDRMELAGDAPARSSYRVFFGPPLPPDESWCARITEPSSMPPISSSLTTAARKMSRQTSRRAQLRNRLYTVFHFPYRSGRSRQGAPVFAIHNTALIKSRSERFGGRPKRRGSKSRIFVHWSSVSSCRRILMLRSKNEIGHKTLL